MCQQMFKIFVLVSLLVLPVSAFSAAGGDEQELHSPTDANVENITVIGRRPEALRKLMLDFMMEIGHPASRARGYARWEDRLCVGVYNLPDKEAAQYIANKITVTALELGLKTGALGCKPNLHIVFSPDAQALASSMVESSPSMFRPFGNAESTTQGEAALERFKTSDAPVRWWQVTMVIDETDQPAIPLPGLSTPVVRAISSRLRSTVRDAIWGGLIIVDVTKLQNAKWPQMADYLAMVSLAQVQPDARPSGHDSILNLFAAGNPPQGMTDMDRTYLQALYKMDTTMLPHAQRGVLSNMMVRVQTANGAE